MKIMIVEDDTVSALALSGALRAQKHEVVVAHDGVEALALLREAKPRVIVSDWRMPTMDGLELCRLVRERESDYVYFILITVAESTDANEDAAIAAGVDDFLAKPLSLRELKTRLHVAERILGFTRTVRELESFLPICAHCRRIRDDQNYWQQVECYVADRMGTKFSHGICPDCYQQHIIPDLQRLNLEIQNPGDA